MKTFGRVITLGGVSLVGLIDGIVQSSLYGMASCFPHLFVQVRFFSPFDHTQFILQFSPS